MILEGRHYDVSKTEARHILCQLFDISDEFSSNCQCDLRKSHNIQYYLLAIREKWIVVNKRKGLGVFHLLFKVFDYLYDELLLATQHV